MGLSWLCVSDISAQVMLQGLPQEQLHQLGQYKDTQTRLGIIAPFKFFTPWP